AEDILPALTRRIAQLEADVASMQADLESEQARLATYSEADPTLSGALSDGYRSADAIGRRARTDADQVLKRAVDERRTLAREIQRLRDERESLQDEIASLHRGEMVVVPTTQPEARPSHDLQTAVMEEMRVPEPIAQSSVPPVEARSPEPAAMIESVQENASSTQQIEAIEPPAPPTVPDARIDALWEAAAPPEASSELAPAPVIEFAPPPPLVDFAQAPAIDFATEPPYVVTPAPANIVFAHAA